MRHIPEEELHAYLDQALSRSQCVEIERHLAMCSACRSGRDGIAALRDRTTALLAVLSPPLHTLPPSFESIRRLSQDRVAMRRRLFRIGMWAASIALAVGLGWGARRLFDTRPSPAVAGNTAQPGPAVATTPDPDPAAAPETRQVATGDTTPASSTRAARPLPPTPDSAMRRSPAGREAGPALARHTADSVRPQAPQSAPAQLATVPDTTPTRALESTQAPLNSRLLASDREMAEMAPESMWRLVSQADAEQESGAPLAKVPGLPVVQVKIQGLMANERIVAVDQQLPNGQLVRTMEGPAAQMSDMLVRDGRRALADNALSLNATEALEALMTMRFGNRMVVVRGPADSVRSLMSRVALPDKKGEK